MRPEILKQIKNGVPITFNSEYQLAVLVHSIMPDIVKANLEQMLSQYLKTRNKESVSVLRFVSNYGLEVVDCESISRGSELLEFKDTYNVLLYHKFGIEIAKPFLLNGSCSKIITSYDGNLYDLSRCGDDMFAFIKMLKETFSIGSVVKIFNGELFVKQNPPNIGEMYYYIDYRIDDNSPVIVSRCMETRSDLDRWKNERCFTSYEEAEKHLSTL